MLIYLCNRGQLSALRLFLRGVMDHLPVGQLQNIVFTAPCFPMEYVCGFCTMKSKDNIYVYGGKNETVF